MILPKPPSTCQPSNSRPINFGFAFQFRLFVKGFCRIRGFLVHGLPRMKAPFELLICADNAPANAPLPMRTIGG